MAITERGGNSFLTPFVDRAQMIQIQQQGTQLLKNLAINAEEIGMVRRVFRPFHPIERDHIVFYSFRLH